MYVHVYHKPTSAPPCLYAQCHVYTRYGYTIMHTLFLASIQTLTLQVHTRCMCVLRGCPMSMWVSLCPQRSVLLSPVGMAEESAVGKECVTQSAWWQQAGCAGDGTWHAMWDSPLEPCMLCLASHGGQSDRPRAGSALWTVCELTGDSLSGAV